MPINESKFCHDHDSCESPIVSSHEVSDDSRESLNKFKKKESSSEAVQNNDFYVVEKILEIKETNNVKEFLVSWVGYPEQKPPGSQKTTYQDSLGSIMKTNKS